MKKSAIIAIGVILSLVVLSQNRTFSPSELREKSCKSLPVIIDESINSVFSQKLIDIKESYEGQTIGNTYYDLQTNYSMPTSIFYYNDETIGTVWTMGLNFPAFSDRGTGYNYFNGSDWGILPTNRIETRRTARPSYMPFGLFGEMVSSYDFSVGSIILNKRDVKGTGVWSQSEIYGPTGVGIAWDRTTTSGIDRNVIQALALSKPVQNGGVIYQGLNGALLYSRSSDGGLTWEQNNAILDGMTSTEYTGFKPDSYEWATLGDTIAFLVGSPWVGLFIMKSTDNGTSWTKTVIWEHPYPLFDYYNPITTETFYCVDGAHSLRFDQNGKVHIVFGINRVYSTGSGSYWYPGVGGIGYWNEDMPTFSNDYNALNIYGGPGSEMVEDYNFIGWTQDVNGNDTIDVLNDWGTYYLGFTSMPQLVIDDQNNIYVVFSSVTEGYDNGIQNYRHLWARAYNQTNQSWGEFIDLNSDSIFVNSECVFPSCSPTMNDQVHLIFMEDNDPGLAVRGDHDPYGNNNIRYLGISKAAFGFYLDVKLYLEGPYNGTNMNTDLNALGYLPLLQPYNMAPWNYEGDESVPVIPNPEVVDWVLVELSDTTEAALATESTIIARKAVLLLSNGQIVDRDGISNPFFSITISDSLFVVIKHRNHIEVITANPAQLTGNTYSCDLTIGEDQFYGGKYGCTELSPGIWGAISANGIHDQQINNLDKNDQWYPEFGLSGYYMGDFDMNGTVDNNDRDSKLNINLGKGKTEP